MSGYYGASEMTTTDNDLFHNESKSQLHLKYIGL